MSVCIYIYFKGCAPCRQPPPTMLLQGPMGCTGAPGGGRAPPAGGDITRGPGGSGSGLWATGGGQYEGGEHYNNPARPAQPPRYVEVCGNSRWKPQKFPPGVSRNFHVDLFGNIFVSKKCPLDIRAEILGHIFVSNELPHVIPRIFKNFPDFPKQCKCQSNIP